MCFFVFSGRDNAAAVSIQMRWVSKNGEMRFHVLKCSPTGSQEHGRGAVCVLLIVLNIAGNETIRAGPQLKTPLRRRGAFVPRTLRCFSGVLWEKRKGVTAHYPRRRGPISAQGFGFGGPVPKKSERGKKKPGGPVCFSCGARWLRYTLPPFEPRKPERGTWKRNCHRSPVSAARFSFVISQRCGGKAAHDGDEVRLITGFVRDLWKETEAPHSSGIKVHQIRLMVMHVGVCSRGADMGLPPCFVSCEVWRAEVLVCLFYLWFSLHCH